eukprot:TRINITY_DN46791_c0_g1_i1.p1 TRINITY_DN46791_c0_g1~~TRINITY_DN46791_c0_g1_i1.p1  ORF type:complete len:241 (+),score=19.61 TRINITY_DN46791_c0_g1_i1:50-772(+)
MSRTGLLLFLIGWCRVEGGMPGYGQYCNDGSVPTRYPADDWAEEAVCADSDVQEGWVGSQSAYDDQYLTVNLVNMTGSMFCCNVNYTTVIERTQTVESLDDQARRYHEAASKVLARFNCRDFYPYFNCTPCQMAYRSWVCSVMFPRKCKDTDTQFGRKQKTCSEVCYEVVRKCPVELEFHCPTDDSYGQWDGGEPITDPATFRGRCNPMQLNLNPAHQLQPVSITYTLLILATVIGLIGV